MRWLPTRGDGAPPFSSNTNTFPVAEPTIDSNADTVDGSEPPTNTPSFGPPLGLGDGATVVDVVDDDVDDDDVDDVVVAVTVVAEPPEGCTHRW